MKSSRKTRKRVQSWWRNPATLQVDISTRLQGEEVSKATRLGRWVGLAARTGNRLRASDFSEISHLLTVISLQFRGLSQLNQTCVRVLTQDLGQYQTDQHPKRQLKLWPSSSKVHTTRMTSISRKALSTLKATTETTIKSSHLSGSQLSHFPCPDHLTRVNQAKAQTISITDLQMVVKGKRMIPTLNSRHPWLKRRTLAFARQMT